MSDANPPKIPPRQPDSSSANGDWQEGNLEEQLLLLSDFSDSTHDNIGNLEEQILSLLETVDDRAQPLDLEAFLVDSQRDLPEKPLDNQIDWFKIAHQLEEQNQQLSQNIIDLTKALADSQEQLQAQIQRSHDAETTITQQAEELDRQQEQIARLIEHEQEVQRQQQAIATLSEQIAQLEREYAVLQEDCNDQAQQIVTMEKHLRELWSRLHRQQRYTLEYKAALEQYLGISGDRLAVSQLPDFPMTAASVSAKVSAIEPWSGHDQPLFSVREGYSNADEIDVSDRLEGELAMEVDAERILENSPTTSNKPEVITASRSNWPSPAISSAQQSQSQVAVDLPSFLRTRRSR
jgi:chromosome segregation ATPase